jgi:hypothetical protein
LNFDLDISLEVKQAGNAIGLSSLAFAMILALTNYRFQQLGFFVNKMAPHVSNIVPRE